MQVSNPNNIKIYNLSAGKSLPEWLSDRKKRNLQKQDVDLRRRIELIQDFDMPAVSNCVQVSKDRRYILASGVYKPRVKCFDVSELSMKFERCFDSEVVKFQAISDDYSKLVFLQNDRYIEFHAQHGRYFRTRIPKYGTDFSYHYPSCDLYFVGVGSEIYRINLEQGRFLNSLKTDASASTCCEFNPDHHLFACGTVQGLVECWDPRTRRRVGKLDCALSSFVEDNELGEVPSVTALRFKDALTMAVGTSTGQILLYDIRSSKPLLVKDQMYGLPIRDIEFHVSQNLVLSLDSRILKIWDASTGKAFTSIEPETNLNNLCVFPDSGLLFMANESPKIFTYYIPSLGPAPRWCSFLDNLTEELEENPAPSVYDDYKFVTRTELDSLGLTHLIGSSLLRAYMHGYFMDIRLYHKAKSITDPFAYEEYRKKKIREKIEESRANRVIVKKLPKVNRALAEKLMDQEQEQDTKKKKKASNLLGDSRFAKMFEDPDFQVDEQSEEFRLLNPVVAKMEKAKKSRKVISDQFAEVQESGEEGRPSDEESSSDDDDAWKEEVKKQHRLIQQERKLKRKYDEGPGAVKPKFFEIKEGEDVKKYSGKGEKKRVKQANKTLGERLADKEDRGEIIRQSGSAVGSMEMSFKLKKSNKEEYRRMEAKKHHEERKNLRRSAGNLSKPRQKPKFWMGQKR